MQNDVLVAGGGPAGMSASMQSAATGAMAALSAQQGVDLRDLPLTEIRALLQEHDAIVPTSNFIVLS